MLSNSVNNTEYTETTVNEFISAEILNIINDDNTTKIKNRIVFNDRENGAMRMTKFIRNSYTLAELIAQYNKLLLEVNCISMREKFKKKLNDRFDKKMFIKAILGSYLIFNNFWAAQVSFTWRVGCAKSQQYSFTF